ncbi:MAG TPA: DsbA family oxidoreductase [Bacteroidia bacterium]
MKIEIWSDVACPFCYIGKRRLEEALSTFEHKDEVEIEWKSYLLNPDMTTDADKTLNEYLAENKGWTKEYTQQVQGHVSDMAAEVGLEYHLDKAIPANTRQAHNLIQLAKTKDKGEEMEEVLFKAYFTEGKNLDDVTTLVKLGTSIGLSASDIEATLNNSAFNSSIEKDIYEGIQIGVKGVPFFVFDNRFGISGAQPLEVFTRTLRQTHEESQS